MKIACVGDIGVDYYENLDIHKPGGIAFNVAYNLSTEGKWSISLISAVGTDTYSNELIELLKTVEIDASHMQQLVGTAAKQNISLKDGERKFTGYNAGVLQDWKLSAVDINFIKQHDVVFSPLSDGMEDIFRDVEKMKGKIIKVADFSQDYEFADFDMSDNVISKHCQNFDIIFVGGQLHHKPMVGKLAKMYPTKVFVLTLGSNGCVGFVGDKVFVEPARKNLRVVDTTGAGDAFEAEFISSWLCSHNIQISLEKATVAAAKAVTYVGSVFVQVGGNNGKISISK